MPIREDGILVGTSQAGGVDVVNALLSDSQSQEDTLYILENTGATWYLGEQTIAEVVYSLTHSEITVPTGYTWQGVASSDPDVSVASYYFDDSNNIFRTKESGAIESVAPTTDFSDSLVRSGYTWLGVASTPPVNAAQAFYFDSDNGRFYRKNAGSDASTVTTSTFAPQGITTQIGTWLGSFANDTDANASINYVLSQRQTYHNRQFNNFRQHAPNSATWFTVSSSVVFGQGQYRLLNPDVIDSEAELIAELDTTYNSARSYVYYDATDDELKDVDSYTAGDIWIFTDHRYVLDDIDAIWLGSTFGTQGSQDIDTIAEVIAHFEDEDYTFDSDVVHAFYNATDSKVQTFTFTQGVPWEDSTLQAASGDSDAVWLGNSVNTDDEVDAYYEDDDNEDYDSDISYYFRQSSPNEIREITAYTSAVPEHQAPLLKQTAGGSGGSNDGVVTAISLSGTTLTLTRSVGTALTLDVASLASDGVVTDATLADDGTLTLTVDGADDVDVDLSGLMGATVSSYVGAANVGGTADAATLTPTPAITAYSTGYSLTYITEGANTTTDPTVDVSSVGAVSLKKSDGSDFAAGELTDDTRITITYDGTNFRTDIDSSAAQDGVITGISRSGNTITITRSVGEPLTLDVSGLVNDGVVTAASLGSDNVLTLTLSVGGPVTVDLSSLSIAGDADGVITGISLDGSTITITLSVGDPLTLDVASLVNDGVVTDANLSDAGILTLTVTGAEDVTVDISSLMGETLVHYSSEIISLVYVATLDGSEEQFTLTPVSGNQFDLTFSGLPESDRRLTEDVLQGSVITFFDGDTEVVKADVDQNYNSTDGIRLTFESAVTFSLTIVYTIKITQARRGSDSTASGTEATRTNILDSTVDIGGTTRVLFTLSADLDTFDEASDIQFVLWDGTLAAPFHPIPISLLTGLTRQATNPSGVNNTVVIRGARLGQISGVGAFADSNLYISIQDGTHLWISGSGSGGTSLDPDRIQAYIAPRIGGEAQNDGVLTAAAISSGTITFTITGADDVTLDISELISGLVDGVTYDDSTNIITVSLTVGSDIEIDLSDLAGGGDVVVGGDGITVTTNSDGEKVITVDNPFTQEDEDRLDDLGGRVGGHPEDDLILSQSIGSQHFFDQRREVHGLALYEGDAYLLDNDGRANTERIYDGSVDVYGAARNSIHWYFGIGDNIQVYELQSDSWVSQALRGTGVTNIRGIEIAIDTENSDVLYILAEGTSTQMRVRNYDVSEVAGVSTITQRPSYSLLMSDINGILTGAGLEALTEIYNATTGRGVSAIAARDDSIYLAVNGIGVSGTQIPVAAILKIDTVGTGASRTYTLDTDFIEILHISDEIVGLGRTEDGYWIAENYGLSDYKIVSLEDGTGDVDELSYSDGTVKIGRRHGKELTADISPLRDERIPYTHSFELLYLSDDTGETDPRWTTGTDAQSRDTINILPEDSNVSFIGDLRNGSKIQVRNIDNTYNNTFTLSIDVAIPSLNYYSGIAGTWDKDIDLDDNTTYLLHFSKAPEDFVSHSELDEKLDDDLGNIDQNVDIANRQTFQVRAGLPIQIDIDSITGDINAMVFDIENFPGEYGSGQVLSFTPDFSGGDNTGNVTIQVNSLFSNSIIRA